MFLGITILLQPPILKTSVNVSLMGNTSFIHESGIAHWDPSPIKSVARPTSTLCCTMLHSLLCPLRTVISISCALSLFAQIIDECVLCVHGGLSPDIKTIDQIRSIERNQEIPHKGAFCGRFEFPYSPARVTLFLSTWSVGC